MTKGPKINTVRKAAKRAVDLAMKSAHAFAYNFLSKGGGR